jgi:hypothetical protein
MLFVKGLYSCAVLSSDVVSKECTCYYGRYGGEFCAEWLHSRDNRGFDLVVPNVPSHLVCGRIPPVCHLHYIHSKVFLMSCKA